MREAFMSDALSVVPAPERRRMPDRRLHIALDFEVNGQSYTAGVGLFDDGSVGEVFLTARKYGSAAGVAAGDAAVATSLALQHGCDLATLRRAAIRDPDGKASGVLGAALDLIAQEFGGCT
jgi:hypothetical protein